MEKYELGPNGGLVYCMEYLLENLDWLEKQIESLDSNYIIFDFPGQVYYVYIVYHNNGIDNIWSIIFSSLISYSDWALHSS